MKKLVIITFTASCVWGQAKSTEQIHPSVRYHENGKIVATVGFASNQPTTVTDDNGCKWLLTIDKRHIEDDKTAQDYTFCWELKQGIAKDVFFSIDFVFDSWTADNYVFVPAIVYDGNRFATKDIGYPPFWYDPTEWRVDMPTTITSSQPTLGKKGEPSKAIELTSGNASTPLMAYFSEKDHKAWMVQTHQGNQLGDYGLSIKENEDRSKTTFSITAPVTRSNNGTDMASTVKEGETVSITCQVYQFKAKRLNDMMNRFMFVRSQGDWLYLSQLQMNLLRSRGIQMEPKWPKGTRKLADAFVRLWDTYGQFGQFVNVETGELCIGHSAAGAIVPAGLALASQTYNEPRYLTIACLAARDFYTNYVTKGYTTGGSEEILSTPDSASAFHIPEHSWMGKIGAHSCSSCLQIPRHHGPPALLAVRFPLPRFVRELHPLDNAHAKCTTKKQSPYSRRKTATTQTQNKTRQNYYAIEYL